MILIGDRQRKREREINYHQPEAVQFRNPFFSFLLTPIDILVLLYWIDADPWQSLAIVYSNSFLFVCAHGFHTCHHFFLSLSPCLLSLKFDQDNNQYTSSYIFLWDFSFARTRITHAYKNEHREREKKNDSSVFNDASTCSLGVYPYI